LDPFDVYPESNCPRIKSLNDLIDRRQNDWLA
jgi:hypothetical protein